MSELKGIVNTKAKLKGTINTSVKQKGVVSVGGTLIGAEMARRGLKGEKGDTGDTGATGVGISSIAKTGTAGKVDTYTITYTDGNTATFDVTNGQDGDDGADGFSPIANVTKVGDTATITITDKDGTTTADIYDGSGGASAFIAEYGVTTYADVKDAYDEDAIIICTIDDSGNTAISQLAYFDDANDTFFFAEPIGDGYWWASIASDDTWDDGSIQFASTDTATQLRDGLMSALDWQKLDGIASGAEVNVQSDWSQADTTADDYIKNKPAIPSATSTTPKMDGTASVGSETTWAKGDHVHPTDTSRASSSHTHTKSDITDFPTLATVATSGDYDDLLDKPAIHNVPSGGTSGQVLSKDSNDDYDLAWTTVSGGGGGEIVYCTCTDSASTVAKTATVVTGTFSSLTTGAQVAVKFTYTNTATNPTLNVAGTGAKAIMRGGTAHVGTNANESWNAGTVVFMLYDGSVWNIVGWLNTTYTGGTGAQIIAGSEALNKVWSPQQIHDGIVGLADANVQSDWNEADNTKDDYIKNKPTIPSKTSDLNNDSGFITAETDPVFSASASSGISSTEISNWNNGKLSLDTTAASGTTDGDLYAAIVALGWASDVIE